LRGREGFGILSSSRRACEAGFNIFVEMKCLFFTTLEAVLKRWQSHEHRKLLSVTSDVGVASDACWVLRRSAECCTGAFDA